MKTRICLILLALMIALPLTGCQQAAAKTEELPAAAAEEAPQPKPTRTASSNPKPQQNTSELSWIESCSVEQAASASKRTLVDLGFGISSSTPTSNTRSVTTRDPKTGRTITKQVPITTTRTSSTRSSSGSVNFRSDGLSATLMVRSVAGIEFQIVILLIPENACQVTINASSLEQATDILKQQSNHLKQKISQAIQNPEAEPEPVITDESLPYPETMVFDRTIDQVSSTIYNWSQRERFKHSGGGEDKYYRSAYCEGASRIKFEFQVRLINDNKTKLDIRASGYEGKDEFNLILKGLLETLQELQTDQPDSKTVDYIKTISLDHTISSIYQTLVSWIKENSFTFGRNSGGDAFYRYFSCRTAAGIEFNFQTYLIDTNKTKLEMTVGGQENREEFPMILKSLESALKSIGDNQTESIAPEAEQSTKLQQIPQE